MTHEYTFQWGESTSAFMLGAWTKHYVRLAHYLNAKDFALLVFSEKRHTTFYISKEWIQLISDYTPRLLENNFREHYLRDSLAARTAFSQLLSRVQAADLKAISKESLFRFLEEYCECYSTVGFHFHFSQYEFTNYHLEFLKSGLKEYFGEAEIPYILSVLLAPKELDIIKREELALMSFAAGGFSRDDLKNHSLEYSIMFYNSYDEETNLRYLESRIKDLKHLGAEGLNRKAEEIKSEVRNTALKQKEALDRISDPRVKAAALLLRDFGFDRLELKCAWSGAEYRFVPLFAEVARRLKIPLSTLFDGYVLEDVKKALFEGKLLDKEELSRRYAFYLFYLEPRKSTFFSGDAARDVALHLVPAHFNMSVATELKGLGASSGIAKGYARVVNVVGIDRLLKDLEEFREGEILVTTMTQPNMVILAKKASAMVTNEGGITSHAAVISREFGVPCIVGTRTATKVIKTGDLIEVDANSGIVRILKNA